LYAPDLQAAYEEFGCNDGNVFFMGIDKGNTNANVMEFDSIFGVHYPGISGQDGGGNAVHFSYEIQATPTFLVIYPDRSIAVNQVWPPTYENLVDSISNAGGILQPCLTNIAVNHLEDILSIGPNPVKDYAYLHLDLVQGKEIEIHIFNLTGKNILALNPAYYPAGKNIVKADISLEPEGFYFVQVVEKGEVIATKKLILVK
jgi:hypothetical protein